MSDEMKDQEGAGEVNTVSTDDKKRSSGRKSPAKKSGGKAAAQDGPWVYVGPSDIRKQLKTKTAYLQIPAGMDEAFFVALDDYPAWEKQQKEAGK